MSSSAVRSVLLAATLFGCGSEPEFLGQSAEISWWTDHETGDFSDWERDGKGATWAALDGTIDVVSGNARSGQYALAASVASPGVDSQSAGIAIRRDTLPEAYYSAWYYVPEAPTDTSYWLFFKFRSRRTPSDSTSSVDVWDLDFMTGADGVLELALYRHVGRNDPRRSALPIPIRRWFQIEAHLIASSDSSGRLSIWQDGTLVFDVFGPTMPSSFVEWQVGAIAERITPAKSVLFVDDAAISTERLGPNYPTFWRAN